jgi:hypothetical protein
VVEAVLLYLNTGSLLLGVIQNANYTDVTSQTGSVHAIGVALALLGIVTFALALVIGLLAPSWRAALALPILAVCLALILSYVVGLVYTPTYYRYLPLYALQGPAIASGLTAYWLNLEVLIVVPLACFMFGGLGWVGWVARRAFAGVE